MATMLLLLGLWFALGASVVLMFNIAKWLVTAVPSKQRADDAKVRAWVTPEPTNSAR